METTQKKLNVFSFILSFLYTMTGVAQTSIELPAAKVEYDAYEKLVAEVKEHRKSRLVDAQTFLKMSRQKKVIILDTRSDAMYASKHVKGAIHLNFSDFTQTNLANLIPSPDYTILIYCNNNFDNDEVNFATKAYVPPAPGPDKKALTLALNIPTYINLYGYGYRNVYELNELVSVFSAALEFEGTAVYPKTGSR
ncbi:MAG: rhodanese-like domain-containing protein [Bacteroidia bacterium]